MKKLSVVSLAAVMVFAGTLLAADGAFARDRETTVTGSGNNTVTRDVNAGVTSDGYQRGVTTTGPGGKKSVSHGSTTKRSGNTLTTTTTGTGPAGNSGSVTTSTTVNK